MFKNQNGFTTVELLVSAFILVIVMIAGFKFFETYDIKSAELGEYETAKLLAVNGVENERAQIKEGDTTTGIAFRNEMFVNTIRFETIVLKEEVTNDFDYINNSVPMYKLTSTVEWKNRDMEVVTYVSGK